MARGSQLGGDLPHRQPDEIGVVGVDEPFPSPIARARRWWFGAESPVARAANVALLGLPIAIAHLLDSSVCPTALVAGVPCPGCGLTRATIALAAGDWHLATALNPLALLLCPIYVVTFAYAAYRYVRFRNIEAERWYAGPILIVSMSLLTVVWAARWFGWFGGPVAV